MTERKFRCFKGFTEGGFRMPIDDTHVMKILKRKYRDYEPVGDLLFERTKEAPKAKRK